MLSDEEKKAISILKQRDRDFDELYTTYRQSFIKPYDKSIGIVLNLIEKQSKEIEKYKNVIDNREFTWKQKYEETFEYVKENYTSNDKIKAKIEEINKEMLNEENSLELFYRKKYCKEVLQSLLEKE